MSRITYLINLAKATKLYKTWILYVFELQLALPWIIQNSPHSWLVLMIKKLSKTPKLAKNLLETFARVFNVPIELKGNKYYSKVFKRVYNKL